MPSLTLLSDQRVSTRLWFEGDFRSTSLKKQLASSLGVDIDDFFLTRNGRSIDGDDLLNHDDVVRVQARLLGGKGGFGSMLRALGAQIEKTTNHEAMRDLSGRRVRDVNNEKALTSWLAKTAERQRQREERRKERMDRKRAQLETPKHKFTDANYDQQKNKVLENLDDALEAGLKKNKKGEEGEEEKGVEKRKKVTNGGTKKRKSEEEEEGASSAKKFYGMEDMEDDDDDDDSSSSSSLDSEEENEVKMEGDSEASPGGEDICEAEGVVVEEEEEEEEEEEGEIREETGGVRKRKAPKVVAIAPDSETKIESSSSDTTSSKDNSVDAEAQSSPSETSEPLKKEETLPSDPDATSTPPPAPITTPSSETDPPSTTPPSPPAPISTPPSVPLALDDYSSTSELEALGLETLKAALMAIGLKCGGTLEERAARLWSVRGKETSEWDKSLFAKGKGKGKGKN